MKHPVACCSLKVMGGTAAFYGTRVPVLLARTNASNLRAPMHALARRGRTAGARRFDQFNLDSDARLHLQEDE
jgi:hypothetical protein